MMSAMQKHTNRFNSVAILAAFLILAAVTSCGDGTNDGMATDPVGGNGSASDTEAVTVLENVTNLPDTDWEGKTFTVLGRSNESRDIWMNFEIDAGSETGDTVGDAVYRRNSKLEEKYHVNIEQVLLDLNYDELQKRVTAGDHLYDAVFLELWNVGPAVLNGYLLDLYDVEHLDFDQPWWNADVNDKISLCGKLYATNSDFSFRDKSRVYIMLYNIGMAAQIDAPDLVATVREGKWTLDLMTSYTKQMASDLDGNGELGNEPDGFGLAMESYNSFAAFVTSADNMLITKDADDKPMLQQDSDRIYSAVEKIADLTCDKVTAFFVEDMIPYTTGDVWYTFHRSFCGGRSLFVTTYPQELQRVSTDAEFDYGIIPFPKYDETQEQYYARADLYSMLFGIPATTPTPEFSGFMLEALSAASTYTSLNAYYEVACKTKYSYNEESGEMLDLIFNGIRFDLATIYDVTEISNIFASDIPQYKKIELASRFEKSASRVEKNLAKIVEVIETLEH